MRACAVEEEERGPALNESSAVLFCHTIDELALVKQVGCESAEDWMTAVLALEHHRLKSSVCEAAEEGLG